MPSASAEDARLAEHEDDEEPDERREAEEEVPKEVGEDLRPAPPAEHSQEPSFPDPRGASSTNV